MTKCQAYLIGKALILTICLALFIILIFNVQMYHYQHYAISMKRPKMLADREPAETTTKATTLRGRLSLLNLGN